MMGNRDFERNIYNLLGLGFDAVDMAQTIDILLDTIDSDNKIFLSTPNLNFLIAAQKNEQFRNSVINSDLSIADGMPIVFMCKLLKLPIKERVAGSSLIEALRSDTRCIDKPVKVFFFGGQDEVAKQAHLALNENNDGLISVGYLNPGFGTVEDMSSQDILDEINAADPEFLIVSLGAAKGQAWIEANKDGLNANVISHLGAVVNFVAGTVKRAPNWVQKIHMEWIWRIKEEPALFGRYWNDGFSFLWLLIRKVLPYARVLNRDRLYSTPSIEADFDANILKLKGSMTTDQLGELREIMKEFLIGKGDFTIDMTGVSYVDQSFLGLMLVLRKTMSSTDGKIHYVGINPYVEKIMKLNNLQFLVDNS